MSKLLNPEMQPPTKAAGEFDDLNFFTRMYKSNPGMILILLTQVVLMIGLTLGSPYFMTFENFAALILDASVYVLMAMGLAFVISTGGIDLTPGFGLAFTGVATALVMQAIGPNNQALAIILGIAAGLIAGMILGAANGFLIAYLNMQPMIATLAMMLVAWGASLVLTGTKTIPLSEFPVFTDIANSRTTLAEGIFFNNSVYIMIVGVLLAVFLLNKTLIGRYALAIGSNEEATRLSGVNVAAWKFRIYTLAGMFTGLAGVLMASKLSSGKPDVGQGYELYAIAAAVLGGASLRGGRSSIIGATIGAIVIATIRNGSVLLSVPDEWQKIILGLVIVVAVYLDVRRKES